MLTVFDTTADVVASVALADPAAVRAALFRSGAGAIVAGRTWVGGEPDRDGCLVVYQETGYEDMAIGLAVPDGNGWYLGCTACQTRLAEPPGGKCPGCRERGRTR